MNGDWTLLHTMREQVVVLGVPSLPSSCVCTCVQSHPALYCLLIYSTFEWPMQSLSICAGMPRVPGGTNGGAQTGGQARVNGI